MLSSFWCMDPTAEECAAFNTIQDVVEWLEMDPQLCAAFTAATGVKSSLRSWARIPAERYTEVIKTLMVNDGGVERRQTPAEEGQAGDLRRIALLLLQGPSASAGAGGGKEQQHTSQSAGIQGSAGQAATGAMGSGAVEGGSPGTADCSGSGQGVLGELTGTSGGPEIGGDNTGAGRPALGASKIKISMVMDQADDTEIQPLHPGILRSMIEAWKTTSNDGEDPTEGEEATGDQLSALAFRIRSGRTRFVDFGVWPTRTRLKRYSDRVQQIAEDYHDLWIIACAGYKMRKLPGIGTLRVAACGTPVFLPARCTLGLGFPRGRQGRAL